MLNDLNKINNTNDLEYHYYSKKYRGNEIKAKFDCKGIKPITIFLRWKISDFNNIPLYIHNLKFLHIK